MLYNKIITLYPELTSDDFSPDKNIILLQNDSNGKGDYIAKWEHPTLPCPTDEELGAIE